MNLHDPDYIPLHYLIAKDLNKELQQFRNETIPFLSECPPITFYTLINQYDKLINTLQLKTDSLYLLNQNVYLIYYEKAVAEYRHNNETDGDYFLQRSLQYNAVFPNAILLKLEKLLKKNSFNSCLSLMNTLYYDIEMSQEQERETILFTDKFYDKLYKTGDSLMKIEHAAEALELFEILETFCLNLPSAYCNDDYYHGVLRSKTGIYDSYIAIAKAAEKRGNPKIAAHFYQYAEEYLESNPYLKTYEPVNVTDAKILPTLPNVSSATVVTGVAVVAEVAEVTVIESVANVTEVLDIKKNKEIKEGNTVISNLEGNEPKLSPKEILDKYYTMILQGLALCIKEEFSDSYHLFLEAKKLEECQCFEPDFRVELMLKELSKFLH